MFLIDKQQICIFQQVIDKFHLLDENQFNVRKNITELHCQSIIYEKLNHYTFIIISREP